MTVYELIEYLKKVPSDYTIKVIRDMEVADIFAEDLKYAKHDADKEIVI